jgi:hypothetical protein
VEDDNQFGNQRRQGQGGARISAHRPRQSHISKSIHSKDQPEMIPTQEATITTPLISFGSDAVTVHVRAEKMKKKSRRSTTKHLRVKVFLNYVYLFIYIVVLTLLW